MSCDINLVDKTKKFRVPRGCIKAYKTYAPPSKHWCSEIQEMIYKGFYRESETCPITRLNISIPEFYNEFVLPNKLTLNIDDIHKIQNGKFNGRLLQERQDLIQYETLGLIILLFEYNRVTEEIDYTEFDKHCKRLSEKK
jgi:hypothetical protein